MSKESSDRTQTDVALGMVNRCKAVVENWAGKEIDPDLHGLLLIAEFAWALDLQIELSLVPRKDRA